MSELKHIEIIEAETDSEGNVLGFVEEEEEEESLLYLDDDDDNDDEYYDGDESNDQYEGKDRNHPLACDICDRTFKNIAERNSHIEDHFKSIECPSCLRAFIGDRAFEYHLSSGKCKETVDQSCFRCCVCNTKVFNSIDTLNRHLLNEHSCTITDDQLRCEMCNRTFAKLKYLKKHIREVHDKATRFFCDVCQKEFNRKANLIEHKLIHEGKYLAKCDTCGKSYRTPSALKLHKRTHTGEKPYVCDLCNDKSYAYNTDLKRHKRAVHGIMGNPFPCDLCSKVFYEPKLLKSHLKKTHKIKQESS